MTVRKAPKSGMKVILTFSISLEQAVRLQTLADARKTSPQQIIREFIDRETA
jgi:predicted transcriptional regulator